MVLIKNGFLEVEIAEKGGQIMSVKSPDGCQYIWQGDPEFWKGRALNLFPINGRLYGGHYYYCGKRYEMQIHGFIKDTVLKASKGEDKAEFTFSSNENSREIYPFDFEYKLTYFLKENSLTARYTVTNKGKGNMYFCLGAHPGFNLPLHEGAGEWLLDFCGAKEATEFLLKDGFITGGIAGFKLKGGKAVIDGHLNERISNSVVLLSPVKKIAFRSPQSTKSVAVSYPDLKYIVLWKSSIDAKFICIEPWSAPPSTYGITDELTSKKDITVLEEGKEYNCEIVYTFT